jgi:hypothetical protein
LIGGRACQIVGATGDQGIESKGGIETGLLVMCVGCGLAMRDDVVPGRRNGRHLDRVSRRDRCGAAFRRFRQIDGDLDRLCEELFGHVLQASQIALANPLQDEAIGGDQPQIMARDIAIFHAQGLDPGIELLGW